MDFEILKRSTGARKVLVAGGAGFIGSHLVDYLLSQDIVEKVLVIDNLISGSLENLEANLDDERLDFIEMDVTDPSIRELSGEDFDLVMHLAAVANPIDYEKRPVETLKVNSQGSENLVEIAGRSHARYIFFSSSEVYGNYDPIQNRSLMETDHSRIILNQKRSPYVVGKCFGEEMAINLCGIKDIEYLIIRPFNIYGPKMDMMTNYGRVIPNFCVWGLKGYPLRINGDGAQIRSFCHVDDLINGLVSLINENVTGASVNIGFPYPISIMDLGRLITDILGVDGVFKYVEKYPFEPYIRIPDISLIRELTGWEPRIDLRSGLKRTIEWFKDVGLERYSIN